MEGLNVQLRVNRHDTLYSLRLYRSGFVIFCGAGTGERLGLFAWQWYYPDLRLLWQPSAFVRQPWA